MRVGEERRWALLSLPRPSPTGSGYTTTQPCSIEA